jgi:hypothetical protein
LEGIIVDLNNVVETGGYKLLQSDEAKKPQEAPVQKKLDKFNSKVAKKQVPKETKVFFEEGKALLADQFNFYSFGLTLNKDQIHDIPEKAYLRLN